jgi:hypothetical protein
MTPETDPLGKTVLLVDNHQKAREVRAQRLTVYGIVVDAVSTVREARFCLRHKRYDLVLLAVRGNAVQDSVCLGDVLDRLGVLPVQFWCRFVPRHICLLWTELRSLDESRFYPGRTAAPGPMPKL